MALLSRTYVKEFWPCRGNDAWMRCHHSEAHASRHGKRSNEALRTSRYYNSGHCEAREFPPGPCATVEELVVRSEAGDLERAVRCGNGPCPYRKSYPACPFRKLDPVWIRVVSQ